MKRIVALALALVLALSLTACSGGGGGSQGSQGTQGSSAVSPSGGASFDGVKLEFEVNYQQDAQASIMEELIAAFKAETGADVELVLSGSDHESVMKTRMASGALPDLWNTHGWSVARYSEYLRPLNDQPWYSEISAAILGAVSDKEGNIYVLPLGQGLNGLIYNEDVLKANGIDATQITCVEEFTEAMATVKAAGIIPMVISNSNVTNNGHFFDPYLAAYLTASDLDPNYADDLLAGTFDWQNARPAYDQMAEWWAAGYWNVDALSASRDANFQAMASGEAAFMFYNNDGLNAMRALNPDVNLGVMPMPAKEKGGLMSWGVSEGNNSCIGMWKDSPNVDACLAFLSFLARPENAKRVIIEIEGGIPALTTTDPGDSYSISVINDGLAAFDGKVDFDRFFDQAYLPSGMWSPLKDSVSAFFEGAGGTEENIQKAIDIMQTNYDDLMSGK